MDLEKIQRQRSKRYNEHLKQQIQQKKQYQKQQRDIQKRSDHQYISQIVDRVKNEDYRRNNQRKNILTQVQRDNLNMQYQKQSQSRMPQQNDQRASFNNRINQQDRQRFNKLQQSLHTQKYENKNQQKLKKEESQIYSSLDKMQQKMHLERQHQLYMKSKNFYEYIKKKHIQDPNIYKKAKQIAQYQDQYRNSLIKPFQQKQQIFASIKRDQRQTRSKQNKQIQEEIKKQIDEFNRKKYYQKNQNNYIDDLSKSMLGSVLMRGPLDYGSHYQQLKNQMYERKVREKEDNMRLKEKVEVDNIYGGNPTTQRFYQLDIIDKKLGLRQEPVSPQLAKYKQAQTNNKYENNSDSKFLKQREEQQIRQTQQKQYKQQLNRSYPQIPQHYSKNKQIQNEETHKFQTDYPKQKTNQLYKGYEQNLHELHQRTRKNEQKQYNQSIQRQKQRYKQEVNTKQIKQPQSPKKFQTYNLITGNKQYYGIG